MVLVNNQVGAGAYQQLRHASWHGWTFTDLVFPFFLWIAGVATTLSTAKRVERGDDRRTLLGHVVRRAALLFLIGMALNFLHHPGLASLRIPGVLQRIAVCYLIGSAIFLYSGTRGRVAWLVGCLAVYFALIHPGGYEVNENFAARIDRLFLPGHMWRYSGTWDPEGIVSTLPAVGTFLFGVLAGQFLRMGRGIAEKVVWLILSGNVLLLLGLAMDPIQPINKSLWTVSYTLLTAGLAHITFGACYWLIDGYGWKGRWTRPWVIFGVNALAVYVFHGVVGTLAGLGGEDGSVRYAIFGALEPVLGTANASVIYSLLQVGCSFVFAWVLWRRRWVLKL